MSTKKGWGVEEVPARIPHWLIEENDDAPEDLDDSDINGDFNPLQQNTEIRVSGNKGGDVLEIEVLDVENCGRGNDLIRLKVGHCCVYSIDAALPVEVVTAVLTDWVLKHNGLENAIRNGLPWDETYSEEILARHLAATEGAK